MREQQWYCPNCGPNIQVVCFGNYPESDRLCRDKNCRAVCLETPPPFILALQSELYALRKVAELTTEHVSRNMALHRYQKIIGALRAAGYLPKE